LIGAVIQSLKNSSCPARHIHRGGPSCGMISRKSSDAIRIGWAKNQRHPRVFTRYYTSVSKVDANQRNRRETDFLQIIQSTGNENEKTIQAKTN